MSGPPTACSPIVTANTNANVRAGDSTDYEIVGFLATGATAPLVGRNAASNWWYISYGGGHGWIAQSVATGSCLPASVSVVAPPPLPPTATDEPEAEELAVIHVSYTLSTVDGAGYVDCPNVTATIVTNAAGDIQYHWTRSDGAIAPVNNLHFNSAGSKQVSQSWFLGPNWAGDTHWLGIYIDEPNHQDFGHKTFTIACSNP